MDSRTALSPNTELTFGPDSRYTIRSEIGRGGSCIVYDGSYRTNAGDEKTVRIRECYPFDLALSRLPSGELACPPEEAERFAAARQQMYDDFRLCNELFYADPVSDSITVTLNIYEANGTVYTVSAWAREDALPNYEVPSLRDCVSIVLQTARAIGCIHQAGYLYLDIKPDNISVISGAVKRIQLFDFDSLIPVSAPHDSADWGRYRLSYTRGFAAMELRREQFSRLGFHTDVYGIGALFFYLLFGRTPEAPDCAHGAVPDFTRMRFPGSYPDRLYPALEHFFHKTLAGFYPDRYETMERVCRELEAIEQLCDSTLPYVISTPFSAPDFFVGRHAEAAQFESWCRDETRSVLFLTGMGGIGKSTFVRHCLAARRRDWDSIAILYAGSSLRQTLGSDSMLRINGTERLPEEKESDYFERKVKKLREVARRDRVLLVIDNFSLENDPDLPLLTGLGCKTLFITRRGMDTLNFPVLRLLPLDTDAELETLFFHYLGDPDAENDPSARDRVRAIIRRLGGHTLALELFARQTANSFLSLSEAVELLEARGLLRISTDRVDYEHDGGISYENLAQILTGLFEADRLSDPQISLLKSAALFPAPGIEGRELLRLTGCTETEPLRQLVRYGWVTRDGKAVYLHPLIADVVRALPETEGTSDGIRCMMRTLYQDIRSENRKEELNLKMPETFPDRVRDLPAEEILTDHRLLERYVAAARQVIDALEGNTAVTETPLYRKLLCEMLLCLPRHEDAAVLYYSARVLEHPESYTPAELMDVFDAAEKVLLDRRDFDGAFRIVDAAEGFAVDEQTKSDFCSLLSSIYDTRDEPGDARKVRELLNEAVGHARQAPRLPRRHMLAVLLIGKMNMITRNGLGDAEELTALAEEIAELIRTECLPYSEVRAAFATAMGFYAAEIGRDREEAEDWIGISRAISAKRCASGIDFIENAVIPPAVMYLDLGDFEASENMLLEGIRICDAYPELAVYRRQKHDLHRCLLDICLESGDYDRAGELLADLDEESAEYGYPDTVQPEVRDFLAGRASD